MRTSLQFAWEHGYRHVIFEVDYMEAIQLMGNNVARFHHHFPLIADIIYLGAKDWRCEFVHVLP